MKQFAIVGFGCAGFHAARTIRRSDPTAVIHVFDDTGDPPFNPMLSTYHAAGKLPEEAVFPFGADADISRELGLTLIREPVLEVTADKAVITEQGRHEGYDSILIATGAHALIPGFLSCSGNRYFLMRTLKDAHALRDFLDTNQIRTAAVVGGSMVGIKVAELLHARGVDTTIVDAAPYLFPLAAYESVAREIQSRLESKGIRFAFNSKVSAIHQSGVTFADESTLEADVVCLCIGTGANIDLVRGTGMALNRAIPVNTRMETSIPGIYAAGDCCEGINLQTGKPVIIGLWANAGAQGDCAGANMAGIPTEYYGNILHNITHFFDMDFIGLGDVSLPGQRHHFEGPDFTVDVVMEGNSLRSVNIFGNYKISGILKSHLARQLLGAPAVLSPVQRGLLAKNGLSEAFIDLIGGTSHD